MTVTYSGKGEVSAKNEISIFLFTDPNITEGGIPGRRLPARSRRTAATFFKGLPPVVYIAVVLTTPATTTAKARRRPGPCEPLRMAAGASEGVKAGKDAQATVTFDD